MTEDRNGCCSIKSENATRFSCETCDERLNCCDRFEYCVSCCMHPTRVRWKLSHFNNHTNIHSIDAPKFGTFLDLLTCFMLHVPFWHSVRQAAIRERLHGHHSFEVYRATMSSQGKKRSFRICNMACRSSSKSVVHENAYRHRYHHCYNIQGPPVDDSLHKGLFAFTAPSTRKKRGRSKSYR